MGGPQKSLSRRPGFSGALAAVVFLPAALFAETVVQNLTWSLCQYASIDGNILTVDVPESATNRSWMCSATVDLTPFENREFRIDARVSGVNVRNATGISYLGSKFMLVYQKAEDGTTVYTEGSHPTGTFTNLAHAFSDFGASLGRRSATGTLRFGFQNGCGRYSLDLSSVTLTADTPPYPVTNMDYVVSYPPRIRVAEPLHGVMSPSRAMTEADFATLRDWGANLLRYQMTGGPKFESGTREAYLAGSYGPWIQGKLDHLDQVVLPMAEKYGIQVVVDLHTPPGAGGSGGNNSNALMLNDDVFKEYFVELWRGIATRFKGRRNVYGYDLVNELNHDGHVKWDYWTIQSLAAEAVRAIDPDVTIIMESNGCDSYDAYRYLSPLAMDNVIYQVHMYSPGAFTHQGVNGKATGYVYPDAEQGWDRTYLENCFRHVKDFERRHRAKIYIGEFSAIAWGQGAENWLADWIGVMNSNRWDWTYHAFREWNGWSVEHTASAVGVYQASSDNPRKRALLAGINETMPVYSATWTGNGAVGDAANWAGGVLPDLDRASTVAHFAVSGASATLDRPIALHGMTLGGGFAFADGTNRIDLGRSGIRALDATSAKSYSIGVPVAAGVAQAWQFGTNTVTDFHRPVWLDAGAALTISGRGRANFRAPGRGTNGVVLAGCADQAAKGDGVVGAVYCYTNDVFGTGTLDVDTRRTQLRLVGDFTWNTPVVTHSDQNDWDQPVYFDGNITVDAEWRNTNKNTRLTFARGKRVVFNRTLKTSSACYCSASGSSGVAEIVFNAKLDVGDRFNVGNHMTFVLNMPTNRLNGNSGRVDGTIRCGVPYAIAEKNGAGNRTELFVYSTGVLDLNGHDQATGILCAMGNATGGTVTSAAPATLHLVDSYTVNNYDSWVKDASGTKVAVPGYTNTLVYAGRVTLSKEGFYTNRLTRASTTSGALVVTRGKMEFAPTASWTNASELVVSGTGAFALEARTAAQGAAFPRTLTVRLDPTATLELGSTLEVRALQLGGERWRNGCWGSAEAAAANPADNVRVLPNLRGPGLLRVRPAPDEGTLLVLR